MDRDMDRPDYRSWSRLAKITDFVYRSWSRLAKIAAELDGAFDGHEPMTLEEIQEAMPYPAERAHSSCAPAAPKSGRSFDVTP